MTKDKCVLCIIAALFLLSGCYVGGFIPLKFTFDNNIEGAKFYQSAGKPWSINHEDEITREGDGAIRFRVRALS